MAAEMFDWLTLFRRPRRASPCERKTYVVERTVALIKPDAFRRQLVGAVLSWIEKADFVILDLEFRAAGKWGVEPFYGRQHLGKPYYPDLVKFMSSGPILALVLQRENAIAHWRELMGPADPCVRPAWTLRGTLADGFPVMENLVHGSDSRESFIHEATTLGWYPLIWE
jgi:nucleoside-diphosphate kinase